MEKSLEDHLLQAIKTEDLEKISTFLSKGANPNKTVSNGMTCLGDAANMGNIEILKLLISANMNCKNSNVNTASFNRSRKRSFKCHKRKLNKHDEQNGESSVKCKNLNDRKLYKDKDRPDCMMPERNQGYFVFTHSEVSSGDESRVTSLKSPLSPTSLTPSPQADLEWDEEIGNVAPTTSEDESCSSLYKWYASILENSGAAIAAASQVTNGIDQQDAFAKTALHYAADNGHVDVVKVLIEAGCKVDIPAGNGLTALHVAIDKNNMEIAMLLLEAGSFVNYKTHDKMTPLHYAAVHGYLDLLKCLLKNGAYLEARDSRERTPLYLAAAQGHVDIVRHLYSCGANVNGEDIHGYTPLCVAVWGKHASVVEALLDCGARITHSHKLLHLSISQKQDEIVKLLVNNGGGINLYNDSGDTPLLLAIRTSQPKIARLLLEKGASVSSSNCVTGLNALHMAVEFVKDKDVFEELFHCLIEYNFNMNSAAIVGDTPLNWALLLHNDHAASLMIRHGADVNAFDFHTSNLSAVLSRKSPQLARLLLLAGHDTIPVALTATVLAENSTAKWLYYANQTPLKLYEICRIQVRHMCRSRHLYKYIDSLPLPDEVKRYLTMEDEPFD